MNTSSPFSTRSTSSSSCSCPRLLRTFFWQRRCRRYLLTCYICADVNSTSTHRRTYTRTHGHTGLKCAPLNCQLLLHRHSVNPSGLVLQFSTIVYSVHPGYTYYTRIQYELSRLLRYMVHSFLVETLKQCRNYWSDKIWTQLPSKENG